jgi:hypothetical protein
MLRVCVPSNKKLADTFNTFACGKQAERRAKKGKTSKAKIQHSEKLQASIWSAVEKQFEREL